MIRLDRSVANEPREQFLECHVRVKLGGLRLSAVQFLLKLAVQAFGQPSFVGCRRARVTHPTDPDVTPKHTSAFMQSHVLPPIRFGLHCGQPLAQHCGQLYPRETARFVNIGAGQARCPKADYLSSLPGRSLRPMTLMRRWGVCIQPSHKAARTSPSSIGSTRSDGLVRSW